MDRAVIVNLDFQITNGALDFLGDARNPCAIGDLPMRVVEHDQHTMIANILHQ